MSVRGEFPEYDPSDAEQREMVGEAAELRWRDETGALARVLDTYHGRAMIWWVIRETRAEESEFHEVATQMARLAGSREVGVNLRNLVLQASPESYMLMRREAVERETRYAAQVGLLEDEESDG